MKGYRAYMDRQQVSSDLHEKLLALEETQRTERKPSMPKGKLAPWGAGLAVAACLALVVSLSGQMGGSSGAGADSASMMTNTAESADAGGAESAPMESGSTDGAAWEYDMEEAAEAPALSEPETDVVEAAGDTSGGVEETAGAVEEDAGPAYTCTGSEETETGFVQTWTDEAGGEITATYSILAPETAEPVHDWESLDWDSLEAGETLWIAEEEGWWSFSGAEGESLIQAARAILAEQTTPQSE